MNDTKSKLSKLIKNYEAQVNIEAYFDKDGYLLATDNENTFLSALPYYIIEASGEVRRGYDESYQFGKAPDDAEEVLLLSGCQLNKDGRFTKIKNIEVKRGSLEEMVDNHFEVMNTLNNLLSGE